MKNSCLTAAALALGMLLVSFSGCETGAPGVKSMIGAYTVVVGAPPDRTVAAARKAVMAMKLTEITATSTGVDGRVAARTALGEVVSITVSQVSQNESNVTVRVGAGDETISMEIIRRIKDGL